MTTAAQVDPVPPPPPLLGPLLGSLPDLVFRQEVLRRLGPRALASLARAAHGCAAAVAATPLMQWAKHAKVAASWHLGWYLPPLCLAEACSHAARGGHLEAFQWLHNTGARWDATTCSLAARGGHLEVLQWAREHGCPWNSDVCIRTASRGHLEMLQWVQANDATGEVWNEHLVRRYACGPRKQEVLTWLDGLTGP